MTNFKNFTNQFSLDKTLEFRLEPIQETKDLIEKKQILEKDKSIADYAIKMQEIMNRGHKEVISQIKDHSFDIKTLNELSIFLNIKNKTEDDRKKMSELKNKLMSEVSKFFEDKCKKLKDFKNFEKYIQNDDEKNIFDSFKGKTSYFTGFNINRENMYGIENSSIAHRIVDINFKLFNNNITTYEKIKTNEPTLYADICKIITSDLKQKLNIQKLDDIFTLSFYNNLTFQENIDLFNIIICGYTKDDKTKIKGLKEYVNLFNQQEKDKKKQQPNFEKLQNQILGDSQTLSYKLTSFNNSSEVLNAIDETYNKLINFEYEDQPIINIIDKIKELFQDINKYDIDKIFISNKKLNKLSEKIFNNYSILSSILEEEYEKKYPIKNTKKYENDKKKYLKQDFSISDIQMFINNSTNENIDKNINILDYFKNLKFDNDENIIDKINNNYEDIQYLLNNKNNHDDLLQNQDKKLKIQKFSESLIELKQFIEFLKSDNDNDKDESFYNYYFSLYNEISKSDVLYNKVRNYLSKKPYSIEKFRIYFENDGNFFGGLIDSHTNNSDNGTQYGAYLFRIKNRLNEYDYYIGVSSDSKLFRCHESNKVSKDDFSEFERLDYYKGKDQSFYDKSYKSANNSSYVEDKKTMLDCIYNFLISNNQNEAKIKIEKYLKDKKSTPSGCLNILNNEFNSVYNALLSDVNFKLLNTEMINKLVNTISSINRININIRNKYTTKIYNVFTEVISDIEEFCKNSDISYFSVSKTEFDNAIIRDKKPLFLFKISNKDLDYSENLYNGLRKERGSKNKENLYTMYFKALMDGKSNKFDFGNGKIYYRKKSLAYTDIIIKNGHHYNELKNKFGYPIIKDERYCYDQFILQLSIKINYLTDNIDAKNHNLAINRCLQNNKDVTVLGIDRGERNLIYLVLIDQNGKIIMQKSLNIINNKDYHNLLKEKEKSRKDAKISWNTVENIKNLKEGYLSQVIHEISEIVINNNAIIVMEDLNFGFKQSRIGIDTQIYQKFEEKLIKKFNYLTFKDYDKNAAGGVCNGLQLTNKFESFKNINKQCGILFYVPASYTSKIDPTTGFVNLFKKLEYENLQSSKNLFKKFDTIKYDQNNDCFEFSFNYDNIFNKFNVGKKDWTISSIGHRFIKNKDKNGRYIIDKVNITNELKVLFMDNNINYKNGDLISDITNQNSTDFHKNLIKYLKSILNLRQTNSDKDHIFSPVKNAKGVFFNSENGDKSLPQDSDANGAYHIGKKGLMCLEKINNTIDLTKISYKDFNISNEDYFKFIQK